MLKKCSNIPGFATPGAPALSGTAGSLIAVLDYCLTDPTYGIGWTKLFSGTNVAVYKQGAGTNGLCLRVDDTGTLQSRVVGYESMTDVNTGVGAFPTNAQLAGGLYFNKSTTADATARQWQFVSDGKIFYLINTIPGANPGLIFGDFKSYKANDAFGTCIAAQNATGLNSPSYFGESYIATAPNAASSGFFAARSWTQTGTSVGLTKLVDVRVNAGVSNCEMGTGCLPYPNGPDGGLYMSKILIGEPSLVTRGELPGFFAPLHNRPLGFNDTFAGSGDFAGKDFRMVYIGYQGSAMIETSDTWGT